MEPVYFLAAWQTPRASNNSAAKKIFQVPYWVPRMTGQKGGPALVSDLTEADRTTTDRRIVITASPSFGIAMQFPPERNDLANGNPSLDHSSNSR